MVLVPFVGAAGGLVHRYTLRLSSCTWTAGEPSAVRDWAPSQCTGSLAVLTPVSSHSFSFPSVSFNSPTSYSHSLLHTPLTPHLFFSHFIFFFYSEKEKSWQKYVHFFQRYEFRSTQYCVSLRSHSPKLEDFCSISALGTPKPGHQEQNSDETEKYHRFDFIHGITGGKRKQTN